MAKVSREQRLEQCRAAAKLGGAATKARHGSEHFKATGRKGGEATLALHGRGHMAQAGRAGGRTVAAQKGQAHFAKIGAAGGAKIRERGSGYFSELGRKGVLARRARQQAAQKGDT